MLFDLNLTGSILGPKETVIPRRGIFETSSSSLWPSPRCLSDRPCPCTHAVHDRKTCMPCQHVVFNFSVGSDGVFLRRDSRISSPLMDSTSLMSL